MKTPCQLWEGAVQSNGYGHLTKNGKTLLAHRVSYANKNGGIPYGQLVLHKCDNKLCVNPEHLFVGTHKDNMQDMIQKGRGSWGHTKGERNAQTKLTDREVVKLKKAYVPGRGAKAALARSFKCGWSTVHRILSGRTRKEAV